MRFLSVCGLTVWGLGPIAVVRNRSNRTLSLGWCPLTSRPRFLTVRY